MNAKSIVPVVVGVPALLSACGGEPARESEPLGTTRQPSCVLPAPGVDSTRVLPSYPSQDDAVSPSTTDVYDHGSPCDNTWMVQYSGVSGKTFTVSPAWAYSLPTTQAECVRLRAHYVFTGRYARGMPFDIGYMDCSGTWVAGQCAFNSSTCTKSVPTLPSFQNYAPVYLTVGVSAWLTSPTVWKKGRFVMIPANPVDGGSSEAGTDSGSSDSGSSDSGGAG
jgi:hypothetical protein